MNVGVILPDTLISELKAKQFAIDKCFTNDNSSPFFFQIWKIAIVQHFSDN